MLATKHICLLSFGDVGAQREKIFLQEAGCRIPLYCPRTSCGYDKRECGVPSVVQVVLTWNQLLIISRGSTTILSQTLHPLYYQVHTVNSGSVGTEHLWSDHFTSRAL